MGGYVELSFKGKGFEDFLCRVGICEGGFLMWVKVWGWDSVDRDGGKLGS